MTRRKQQEQQQEEQPQQKQQQQQQQQAAAANTNGDGDEKEKEKDGNVTWYALRAGPCGGSWVEGSPLWVAMILPAPDETANTTSSEAWSASAPAASTSVART